jgi:CNT family concentrative nucleoside transporter
LLAIPVILGLAFLLAENRGAIRWRTVTGGFALQIALALVLIGLPPTRAVMLSLDHVANTLQTATDQGTGFLFGYLGGGALPFVETSPGASFILAFKALPLVLVISALSALLFHWGVLQRVAGAFAWLLARSLGIGGALALGAAVHVFVGMIEAPLLIRPWLMRMQRGELCALMSCGLAGIAGTVMVIYATMLAPVLPDALGEILIAAVLSTPAALAISAVMVPFGAGEDAAPPERETAGALDALVRGTMEGVAPLVGIAAVLIVTITLVALINAALGHLPSWEGGGLTLEAIFALPFRPLVWLIGVDWAETGVAAHLMAVKTVINEFAAYRDLAGLALPPHTRLIMVYALCGFANFGSVGILIGGMGEIVPERRAEVVGLGMRSLVAGTLATLCSGALAGAIGG